MLVSSARMSPAETSALFVRSVHVRIEREEGKGELSCRTTENHKSQIKQNKMNQNKTRQFRRMHAYILARKTYHENPLGIPWPEYPADMYWPTWGVISPVVGFGVRMGPTWCLVGMLVNVEEGTGGKKGENGKGRGRRGMEEGEGGHAKERRGVMGGEE